jgi:hypothetical protein
VDSTHYSPDQQIVSRLEQKGNGVTLPVLHVANKVEFCWRGLVQKKGAAIATPFVLDK